MVILLCQPVAPEVPVNLEGRRTTQDKQHAAAFLPKLSLQQRFAAFWVCLLNLFIAIYIKCTHIRYPD